MARRSADARSPRIPRPAVRVPPRTSSSSRQWAKPLPKWAQPNRQEVRAARCGPTPWLAARQLPAVPWAVRWTWCVWRRTTFHTEGNMVVRPCPQGRGVAELHLVKGPSSCVWSPCPHHLLIFEASCLPTLCCLQDVSYRGPSSNHHICVAGFPCAFSFEPLRSRLAPRTLSVTVYSLPAYVELAVTAKRASV